MGGGTSRFPSFSMKHLKCLPALLFIGASLGCRSETQAVAPAAQPPKDSFTSTIQNNPNIPPDAKKAMLGNQGSNSH